MRSDLRTKVLMALAFLLLAVADANSTVCRLPGLEGFSEAAKRAKALLPPTTRDPREAVVYVEKTPEGLYFHSNFISAGANYPTKIGREKISDGATAFVNIVHGESPTDNEWKATEQTFRDHVKVLLDETVFDSKGLSALDLHGVKHVTIVSGKTSRSLAADVEVLSTNRPPPLVMGKVAGCCLYGIPPHFASAFGERMQSRAFRPSDVSFLSLVRDSGTEAALGKTSVLRNRVAGTAREMQTLENIESAFSKQRGKTVVLVGHVENERYVVRGADNQVHLDVPIAQVRSAARKHDVELIDLGCRTAQASSTPGSVGVTTRFNTVEAIQAVDRALKSSTNYAEFLEGITSEGLKVVIDPIFVQRSTLRAEIYAQAGGRSETASARWWQKVAELFVTFR